ncbi:hypothetical protein BC941DRAFT_434502 [Chlamydoabsidia padenii]|nr:hypothetical protein BC941DRAFT_434502 [Chlamydoabsidia padenii]
MHKYTILLFTLLSLFYLMPVYTFDLKNIIFGNSESEQGPSGKTQTFGYRVPARLLKKQQSSGQDCVQGYFCQNTKSCVAEPKQCPCRLEADIKCPLGKDWYTCIRGDQECDQLGV